MEIHYFQRYHQRENVVTANSMLLLSRLYTFSSDKFYKFLKSSILPEDANIELKATLQTKSMNSVPDAVISQESFKVVIETKLYDKFSYTQLVNHTKAFGNENYKILLSLSVNGLPKVTEKKLNEYLSKTNIDNKLAIIHKHMTFEELIEKVEENLDDRDYEMLDILNDFRNFCYDTGLMSYSWKWLKIRAVGATYETNRKLNLYYDGAESRGHSGFDYLGLYTNKNVRAVGRIISRIVANIDNGNLNYSLEQGEINDEIKNRIIAAIEDSKSYGYNLIDIPHRFFVVDSFVETDFRKDSKGGLWGDRSIDLFDLLKKNINKETTSSELAEALKGRTWK